MAFVPTPTACRCKTASVLKSSPVLPRSKRKQFSNSDERYRCCRVTVRADLGHERGLERASDQKRMDDTLSRIMALEDALDSAVDAEEYKNAAGIRDQLATAKNEDCVLLLSANLNYYDAFSNHSMERIRRLWDNSPSVICQHPLSACHVGYEDVVNSFAVLFSTLPADLRIDISDVRIASFGTMAYVTCVETPWSELLSIENDGKARRHGLLATSVFEKRVNERGDYEYLMVHHVSTPILSGVSVL